jgi:hypothetical protein
MRSLILTRPRRDRESLPRVVRKQGISYGSEEVCKQKSLTARHPVEISLFGPGETGYLWGRSQSLPFLMNLDEASQAIQTCAERMNAVYREVVFDEWAVVSLKEEGVNTLLYVGPRKDHFQRHFLPDSVALKRELGSLRYGVGDFEFARDAAGTRFDAFMVTGEVSYLICNNIAKSMDAITSNELWLAAQVPFVELSEKFRSSPLVSA